MIDQAERGAAAPVPHAAGHGMGRLVTLTGILTLLTAGLAFASLFIGAAPLTVTEVAAGLLGVAEEPIVLIVQDLRLPRILLAMMVGGSLGVAGAALQGLFRNPLADPGIVGVSASAGLGAVIALYFGFSTIAPIALPASAMTGALLSTLVLYYLAAREASSLTLILAGVAISGLAISLMSLAMNLSPNPFAMSEIVLWLLGSVRDRSFADVTLAGPFVLLGWLLLFSVGRSLDALTLGEDSARSLGVDVRLLRLRVILGTSLAVGASVAIAGSIGFVGLVVPHLIRPLVGHQPSHLLLPSALGGAALLVAADLVVRLISVGPELMLGVVTSLIGAPFFFYLILKTGRTMT